MIELFLLSLNCLADINQYGSELDRYLPGNNSNFSFVSCDVVKLNQELEGNIKGTWKISQRNCIKSWCTTIWSYSGDAYGKIITDENCQPKSIEIWTVPSNSLMDSLINIAKDKAKDKFDQIKDKPEYKEQCELIKQRL